MTSLGWMWHSSISSVFPVVSYRPTWLKQIQREEYMGIWYKCHQCEGAGLYSQLLLAGRDPHPISKGVPYHPVEPNYFSNLCPTSCSSGQYLKLMTKRWKEFRLLPLWKACQRLKRSLKNSFPHLMMFLVMLTAPHFHCQQCWWSTASPFWVALWSLRPTGSPPPWLTRIVFVFRDCPTLPPAWPAGTHPLPQEFWVNQARQDSSFSLTSSLLPVSTTYFRDCCQDWYLSDLSAIALKSLVNGNGKYKPLVSSLPWNLFKAPWR